jgi:hypothetical protein
MYSLENKMTFKLNVIFNNFIDLKFEYYHVKMELIFRIIEIFKKEKYRNEENCLARQANLIIFPLILKELKKRNA